MSRSEHNCNSISGRKAKTMSLRKPEGEGNEGDLKTENDNCDGYQRVGIDFQVRGLNNINFCKNDFENYQKRIAESGVNNHQQHKTAHLPKRWLPYFEPLFDELTQDLTTN